MVHRACLPAAGPERGHWNGGHWTKRRHLDLGRLHATLCR
ncbi:hypothetical protein TOK_6183 [Pseudonocardia sp. N23]|nr:hypothetical protein TOK_6183 [Pseudonocardia sp. N23]